MFSKLFSVCLLAAVAAVVACSNNTPFSSDIVPRQFTQDMTCLPIKFRNITTVQLNATHLVYIPTRINYNLGFCQESYVFKLNPWAPTITHYPYLDDHNDGRRINCAVEQNRKKIMSWPQGSTRPAYRQALKNTIASLTVLRDSHCQHTGYGLTQTPYKHPWVQQLISYLRSVAYQHKICLLD